MLTGHHTNQNKLHIVKSTQQGIPVRDFYDGIVVTDDGSFIKILEVLPVPFFLKKISEQNKIASNFETVLKAFPKMLHFKSVSVPADLSRQINDAENNIAAETNQNCKQMGREYKKTLCYGQSLGVQRKFYISFPYAGITKGPKAVPLTEIIRSLNCDANRISAGLNSCGNTVIDPSSCGNPDIETARMFYMLYNRAGFMTVPFEKHFSDIKERYVQHLMASDCYIPPAEYLAPKKISSLNPRYLVIDGMYYSFLYIPQNGYNPKVIAGWLDNFINSFIGVDVDIFLKQLDRGQLDRSLQRNIGRSELNTYDSAAISDAHHTSNAKLAAGKYIWDGINSGQDFYYMSCIITVCGKSPAEVEYKKEELKKIAMTMNVSLHENRFECRQTFDAVLLSSMYNEKFMEKMRRNVLTSGVASLYPFTTFQIVDRSGLYLADDANGSPAIIDLFNRERVSNPHVFICGESGAGKSVTILLSGLRARILHMPVIILAPEKQDEFRRVCDAIGGQFISIGAGSSDRINIMEIPIKDEADEKFRSLIDGTPECRFSSLLEEKLASLSEFLQIYVTDIDTEEKQLLSDAILRTYEKKGITKDNASLWDESGSKYKEMPVLSDLAFELSLSPDTKRLSRIVRSLTEGAGAYFNGSTNVNLSNEFVVIGLEHNTRDFQGLSVYMAMDYAWSQIKRNRTKKKFLIIDEWWKLAFNPLAAEKSLEIAKIARSYGCSMILATQQMSDILAVQNGLYGEKVLGNCATKILLKMQEKDVLQVKEMLDLTDTECNRILKFKAGEALFIAGDNRMTLKFNPSETEKPLVFTDSETLIKYAEQRRAKEAISGYSANVDSAVDIDSLFDVAEDSIKAVQMISLKEWEKSMLGVKN